MRLVIEMQNQTKETTMNMEKLKERLKTAKRVCSALEKHKAIFIGVLALGILMTSNGYCQSAEISAIEGVTSSVMHTIFSSWVKKAALVFGAGGGLIKSWTAGSVKPLALWGGLGLAVNYVPKVVDVIAGIGA
jgi:hypothetical protein